MKRIETMGCKIEHDQVCNKASHFDESLTLLKAKSNPSNPAPSLQSVMGTIINLVGCAADPINLMKMTEIYSPWF